MTMLSAVSQQERSQMLQGHVVSVRDSVSRLPGVELIFRQVGVDSLTRAWRILTQEDGDFRVALPAGGRYQVEVSCETRHVTTVNLELLATSEDSSAVTHTFYVPCRAPDLIVDEAPRLYFAAGQATLSPTAEQTLGVMVRILRATPALAVCLEGHADAQEARVGQSNPGEYLQRLGLLRAQAASKYLHQQGIAASRLSVRSVGSQQPLVPDSVTEYRTLNQCVVFKALIAPPLVEASSPEEKRMPAPPAVPHHRPGTLPPTRSQVNRQ